jgi:hypothetical protein
MVTVLQKGIFSGIVEEYFEDKKELLELPSAAGRAPKGVVPAINGSAACQDRWLELQGAPYRVNEPGVPYGRCPEPGVDRDGLARLMEKQFLKQTIQLHNLGATKFGK